MTPALSKAIDTVLRLSDATTASVAPKTAQEGAELCTRSAHIAHHEGADAVIWQPQLAVAAWEFAASDQPRFANTLAPAVESRPGIGAEFLVSACPTEDA